MTTSDANTLRVAFASSDGETVNQHFGSTRGLWVFEVTAKESLPAGNRDFDKAAKDGNEDKLVSRVQYLAGCDVLYCGQVGHSATRQLLSLGVQPVTVKAGPEIGHLIGELQAQLSGTAEPWLTRILKRKRGAALSDFETSLDEEWSE